MSQRSSIDGPSEEMSSEKASSFDRNGSIEKNGSITGEDAVATTEDKKSRSNAKVTVASVDSVEEFSSVGSNSTSQNTREYYHTKRTLEVRHVNLIAIGGSIGTGLFITIGSTGLTEAGPLGLLLGYLFWTAIILMLTVSVGEMVCYLPIDSPFLNISGRVVDPAFECAASINFWLMQSLYIPFEITAVNAMFHYWKDGYSPAIALCIQIAIYAALNIFVVKAYGESEFWLSLGKLILCILLLFFTLITMCGGNPRHDAFGFRNWKAEGGPIAEFLTTGSSGRFHGFMAGLFSACFVVVSAEYLSMTAGEAKNPRKTMASAFRTVLARLVVFYIGGALSVGILIAYNDPNYLKKASDSSDAAASPYVAAMNNLGISVLPDIVNAISMTSAFSAGNSYTYCSSRTLYALSLKGFAPKFFSRCTKKGVPIYCVFVALAFALASLMQLASTGNKVLNYTVSLSTGSQVLNYAFMSTTYLFFYRACKAQNINRDSFSFKSFGQPYTSYVATFFLWLITLVLGYTVFMPGHWSVDAFLYNYLMLFIAVVAFFVYKFWKKTTFVKPEEADLRTGLDEIEEHEYQLYAEIESGQKTTHGLLDKILSWIM
ncbi:putative amino acid permease [Clavispora lusitaniae]|uniref:Amino acid permease n=1 Tax=Clavispora lusitaniae TaxID=36911 RepID=A0AA91Q3V9_CLALS|nr:putative amino acid permease [Clavispora lusitaniae]